MIRSYSESFFIKTGCGIASARAGNVIGGGDWSSNRLIPDTIISYKDAQGGNYDDAVSNAYGSNIFNLCVALGLPLFFFTTIYGPIILDENVISLITSLSFWFVGLTILSIIFYTRKGGVNKYQAYSMISLYFVFVFYILYKAYLN